jgi:hypothetical protein
MMEETRLVDAPKSASEYRDYYSPKVTIYTKCDFMGSIKKTEAKLHQIGRMDYAQYDNANYYVYTPKRKRSAYRQVNAYKPYTIIVEGWNQVKPEEMCSVKISDTLKQSKYLSFDDRWCTDFDTIINEKIASGELKVIFDDRYSNN